MLYCCRYKEAKVALETSLSCLQQASLDKNKRNRFLKDVQESLLKVGKFTLRHINYHFLLLISRKINFEYS
jgi:hypothetical protein